MQKSSLQNPTHIRDKNSQHSKNKGRLPQLDKEQLQKKPTANVILDGEKQRFPTKIRNKANMPSLTTPCHIVLEVLANAKKQENQIKCILIEKKK